MIKKHFPVSCPSATITGGTLPPLCSASNGSFAIARTEKMRLRLLDFYSRMKEILAKTKKIPQLLWLSFTVVTRSLFLSKCRYDGNKTLGLLRKWYHKTQEWYRLFIIKALLTRCDWIFSCYVLENTKRGHPLGKDLTAFSDVPFPLAAWVFRVIFSVLQNHKYFSKVCMSWRGWTPPVSKELRLA